MNKEIKTQTLKLSALEIQALIHALFDSEVLNLHRKRKGHEHKPADFLREGNEPVNTAFDKLLEAKSSTYLATIDSLNRVV